MQSDYISPEIADRLAVRMTWQNRLICDFMQVTGARVGEVVGMKRAAVEAALQNNCWLTLEEFKTKKQRSVRVEKRLLEVMLANADKWYVFPHAYKKGMHRHRTTVYKQVKRALKGLEVNSGNISPHSYRKQYAVNLLRNTGDLGKVQRILGHTYPSTTLIYAVSDVLTQAKLGQKEKKC